MKWKPFYLLAALFLVLPLSQVMAEETKSYWKTQEKCLTVALYYESRGESEKGQQAVADVIVQRSLQSDTSICKVLKAKGQFSWNAVLMWRPFPKDSLTQQEMASNIVKQIGNRTWKSSVKGSTHFHAVHVKPRWAKKFKFIKRVDKHLFYKEK